MGLLDTSILMACSALGVCGERANLHQSGTLAETWKLFSSQRPSAEDQTCGRYSSLKWQVFDDEGEIGARLSRTKRRIDPLPVGLAERRIGPVNVANRYVLESGEDWLIGIDGGEWGGGLFWVDSIGDSHQLLGSPVQGLFKVDGKLLAMAGNYDPMSEEGKAVLVVYQARTWHVSEESALSGVPRIVAIQKDGSVLVAADGGGGTVYRVRTRPRLMVDRLHDLGDVVPHSILRGSDGAIYVGLRLFVVKLTPSAEGFSEEWFVPEECSRLELAETSCRCVPEG